MRALVTGACGFVGGHLVRHLVDNGDTVCGTLLSEPVLPNASLRNFQTEKADLTAPGAALAIIDRFRPEAIYHLAAISFVPEAEENFDRVLAVNVGMVNHVFRSCHLLKLSIPIVFVSSAEVYGRITPEDLPIREETPPRPHNNYSLSKLMAEQLAWRYEQGGYVRPIVMRPFNHIGPGQNHRFAASSFARQLAEISLGRAAPVISVGNLDARRDFSDVRDIVRAYRLGAVKGRGVYNLGAGRSEPVQKILDTLVEISGLKVRIEREETRMRAAEIPEVYGSIDRAQRELGWTPGIPLRQSLQDIYDFWRSELERPRAG